MPYFWSCVIFLLSISKAALCGGDGWAVKIAAVSQSDEEATIKLRSLQNTFHPLNDTCVELTIHVKLRGQKWLAYPTLAKLENWLFKRNMGSFLLNPIPVQVTLDAIEGIKKASLIGETVDFGLSSSKSEAQPCHYAVRGIFASKQDIQGTSADHAPMQVLATYHYL